MFKIILATEGRKKKKAGWKKEGKKAEWKKEERRKEGRNKRNGLETERTGQTDGREERRKEGRKEGRNKRNGFETERTRSFLCPSVRFSLFLQFLSSLLSLSLSLSLFPYLPSSFLLPRPPLPSSLTFRAF